MGLCIYHKKIMLCTHFNRNEKKRDRGKSRQKRSKKKLADCSTMTDNVSFLVHDSRLQNQYSVSNLNLQTQ